MFSWVDTVGFLDRFAFPVNADPMVYFRCSICHRNKYKKNSNYADKAKRQFLFHNIFLLFLDREGGYFLVNAIVSCIQSFVSAISSKILKQARTSYWERPFRMLKKRHRC